ncbi:SepM family pheromone-processing serine protease [Thermoactinomyces mirandus]|uniref:endopeptidase La n=1 Tax=Thermoactinomyces mirandus TaxID=2756294 RepID=A0A7W1XSK8_9BACL|nr:SepM family pheromone-processing serine protease [Thermoactinomyces mirandus]MBA4602416.1 PDZ domain-containing protein [Thermoactinomyces mirandus]
MNKRQIRNTIAICLVLLVVGSMFLVPIPYYVISPGSAEDVSPLVKVRGGYSREEGDFYLTTISMREGRLFDYLYSKWSDHVQLIPEGELLAKNESEEDYERRQAASMSLSQNHAILAAYRYAGRPITVKVKGVEVLRLMSGQPNALKEGDLITRINHQPVRSVEQLSGYLGTKETGEKVEVLVRRNQVQQKLTITLQPLPREKGKPLKAGLGIVPVLKAEIHANPPVHIDSDNIGGPSAGLMFSLEVLNRLQKEDLTRGYQIAGTGIITEDGQVGQIGGIEFKIMAAAKKGADIFFCPADTGPHDQNEKMAKETVKKYNYAMDIVPVKSLEEAVDYLKRLPSQEH